MATRTRTFNNGILFCCVMNDYVRMETTTTTTTTTPPPSRYANSAPVTFPSDQLLEFASMLMLNMEKLSLMCSSAYTEKGRGFLSVLMLHDAPYFVMQYTTTQIDESVDSGLKSMVEKYNPQKCFIVRLGIQPQMGQTQIHVRSFPVKFATTSSTTLN